MLTYWQNLRWDLASIWAAAQAAIDREERAFRRSPYSLGGAYLPRNIRALADEGYLEWVDVRGGRGRDNTYRLTV